MQQRKTRQHHTVKVPSDLRRGFFNLFFFADFWHNPERKNLNETVPKKKMIEFPVQVLMWKMCNVNCASRFILQAKETDATVTAG